MLLRYSNVKKVSLALQCSSSLATRAFKNVLEDLLCASQSTEELSELPHFKP